MIERPVLSEDEGAEELPEFLRFAPVKVKARRGGWTAQLQRRFVLHLARGASVDEAARTLGRSRQSAYALRSRAGAEGFAAAWDAAVEFAGHARGAAYAMRGLPGDYRSAVETILVPRIYRGRLIGYVQREDVGGVMSRMRTLDRVGDGRGS